MAILGYSFLAAAIFITDLLIKNHIERTGNKEEEKTLCGGRLLIRQYHNQGAFLNVGERRRGLVAVLSLTMTLGATVFFLVTFTCRGGRMLKAGLAFLLGGAYSNTYDRLARKYVVDYVSFPVKNQKIRNIVFNISDFCIMIGALCITLADLPAFDKKHRKKWHKSYMSKKKKWHKRWHAAKRYVQKYIKKM